MGCTNNPLAFPLLRMQLPSINTQVKCGLWTVLDYCLWTGLWPMDWTGAYGLDCGLWTGLWTGIYHCN